MADSLYGRLNMRQLPTGRRTFAAKHVMRIAEGIGDDELAQLAKACVDHDTETLEVEAKWDESRGQTSRSRGNARAVDAEIDELLSSTSKLADAQRTNPNPEVAKAAQTYLDTVFPLGVRAVTRQSYEDQLGWLEAMGRRMTGNMSKVAEDISVNGHFQRVIELTDVLAGELNKKDETISFDQVKAARHQGHELLAVLIFRILSKYADDEETCQKLMAEIDRQDELVGQAYRDNRRPDDVDPDTGEPITDDPTADDVVEPEPTEA